MTGCSAVFEIQLSQHEPMLHEVVPNENAVMPPTAPHREVPTMSPTITSGLLLLNVQDAVQHEFVPPFSVDPSSQSSPASTTLLPHTANAFGEASNAAPKKTTRIVETNFALELRTKLILVKDRLSYPVESAHRLEPARLRARPRG